jgi:hypothetical protein
MEAAVLIHHLGPDGLQIFDGLKEPKTSINEIKDRFQEYFGGGTSILLHRSRFMEAKQGPVEPVHDYANRLRRLASLCEYGASSQMWLRDVFVKGVYDDHLGSQLLAADFQTLTFDFAVAKAETHERARAERNQLNRPPQTSHHYKTTLHQEETYAVRQPTTSYIGAPSVDRSSGPNATAPPPSQQKRSTPSSPPRNSRSLFCMRCGLHSHGPMGCAALNATCLCCNNVGHFARVCRKRSQYPQEVKMVQQPDSESASEGNEPQDTELQGAEDRRICYAQHRETQKQPPTTVDSYIIF